MSSSNDDDVLYLDFETGSTVDLKKTGVAVYAEHKTTRVLCLGYAFNDEPVRMWVPGSPFPQRVLEHVMKGRKVIAHNSAFERYIWNNVLARELASLNLPPLKAEQLSQDTMIRCLYWGLPAKLDTAAEAMGLPFGKDKVGHRTMMQLSKPRETRPDGSLVWWHEHDPVKYARLQSYCEQDVDLERILHKMLPPLPPETVIEFVFDQRMNDRGLFIDQQRVLRLKDMAKAETARLDAEMLAITNHEVANTRSVGELKQYLDDLGVKVSGLAKEDIKALLKRNIPDKARQALELRQEAAKTSVAKLDAMLNARSSDGTVKNGVQFYGAGRTGRYAGRLVQIQNFPRPHLKRDELAKAFDHCNLYGGRASLMLISSLLRSCVTTTRGWLVVVDFAQIEARVLAWLARQADILKVFADGTDVYTYAAAKIGSDNRTLGKVATLGLGYGMGPDRFMETALTYGLELGLEFCQDTVKAWREANHMIKSLWYEIDRAVVDVISNTRGVWRICAAGKLKVGCFFHKPSDCWMLMIRLPSGRDLVYREPEYDTTEGVSYMGLDQYTKTWTRIRSYGAKFVENIVQAIARDLMLTVMIEAETQIKDCLTVGTVHDEGIWDVPPDKKTADRTLRAIETLIATLDKILPWAAGLPMKGEGFVTTRYGK